MLDLREVMEHFGYTLFIGDKTDKVCVPLATLENFVIWIYKEVRVKDVFLDLKFPQTEKHAAVKLLQYLRDLSEWPYFRENTIWHITTPSEEITEAVLAEAHCMRRLPSFVRIGADFEFPGATCVATEFRLRDICVGRAIRPWRELFQDVVSVVEAREQGRLDSTVVWTINQEQQMNLRPACWSEVHCKFFRTKNCPYRQFLG
ncbi:MAG: hypothetical protein G01um101466_207 [Parcubacteria group bacterium Gr01-1014_66]|nr:MAG: hypothetical protein G01um101466_207 [Parcubacteria group bacterium Gr01-1014_66]